MLLFYIYDNSYFAYNTRKIILIYLFNFLYLHRLLKFESIITFPQHIYDYKGISVYHIYIYKFYLDSDPDSGITLNLFFKKSSNSKSCL